MRRGARAVPRLPPRGDRRGSHILFRRRRRPRSASIDPDAVDDAGLGGLPMSVDARSVTVGALLRGAPSAGFDLDAAGRRAGLDRRITRPIAAEDRARARRLRPQSLQAGRVLVFGESEVRYLERPRRRARRARARARLRVAAFPASSSRRRSMPPPELVARCRRARRARCCERRCSTPRALGQLTALLEDRLAPRDARARRARRHPRPRRARRRARAASARASARSTSSCAATASSPTTWSKCDGGPSRC